MMRLDRLAALAGLALVAASAPVHAHGAFGLFYERHTGCCAGCDRPWNAFSGGPAPAAPCGPYAGGGQMPCLPYQGPGDPYAGRSFHPHRWFGRYCCGDPNVGCGMGCGAGCLLKESLHDKLKALCKPHCAKPGCDGGDCGGCGKHGGLFSGGCAGHGCGGGPLFGGHLFRKRHAAASCDEGCCGTVAAPPVPQPQTTVPVSYQPGYPSYYPMPYVPAAPQYPGFAPSWGHGYPSPAYFPMPGR